MDQVRIHHRKLGCIQLSCILTFKVKLNEIQIARFFVFNVIAGANVYTA